MRWLCGWCTIQSSGQTSRPRLQSVGSPMQVPNAAASRKGFRARKLSASSKIRCDFNCSVCPLQANVCQTCLFHNELSFNLIFPPTTASMISKLLHWTPSPCLVHDCIIVKLTISHYIQPTLKILKSCWKYMHHMGLYSNAKYPEFGLSSEHIVALGATSDECESVIATYCTCHYLSFCTNPC